MNAKDISLTVERNGGVRLYKGVQCLYLSFTVSAFQGACAPIADYADFLVWAELAEKLGFKPDSTRDLINQITNLHASIDQQNPISRLSAVSSEELA